MSCGTESQRPGADPSTLRPGSSGSFVMSNRTRLVAPLVFGLPGAVNAMAQEATAAPETRSARFLSDARPGARRDTRSGAAWPDPVRRRSDARGHAVAGRTHSPGRSARTRHRPDPGKPVRRPPASTPRREGATHAEPEALTADPAPSATHIHRGTEAIAGGAAARACGLDCQPAVRRRDSSRYSRASCLHSLHRACAL
jgi:hypothetical protein